MKKRLITWLLAVCMILGMLPVSAIAAAPTAMKITPDKNVFVATQESTGKKENLYICNPAKMVEQTDGSKAGTLTFTVLDQDGKDITRYITWSSDNVGVLRFDDPSEAIATIPEPTKKSSATKVVITATYSKAGGQEFQAAYELTIVPALNLSHADLTDLYPDGIALKEDGSGFECSMKSKLHPTIIYRTYDLYEMTSDKEISVSVGSDWLTIKGKYPGKYTATFTQKNQPDNTVTQIVPVSGVAVETDAKLMGSFTMDTGKTQKLIAYTAHKDDGFVCHSGEDAQVTWTSSDPAVATVDENGVVTAVGLGQAVITAQDDYFSGEQTEGYKGSIKVTVKEAGKPIAESIGISFDGSNNIYTDPAMGSKQKATTSTYKVGDVSMSYSVVYGPFDNNNDKLYLKPQTSLKNLNIAASFDSANVKAEVYHNNTLAGELVYGENFVLFPEAGENDIRVKFAYKDNASAVNEYAFSFYVKPDTNIKAASSPVTLTSPNRDMSKTVKYNNNDEGKAFKAANGVPSSTSGLNNATEWISVVYSDIQKVKVSLKAGHAVYGRIAYRLEENGPIVKESRGTLETDELQFGDKDEIILYVVTTSAEAYLNAKTAGTDPWADATKTTTYKYTIKRSAFSMADMNLTSVSLGNTGTIQSFDPTADSIIGILPSSAANAELTVTAPEGYAVHNPTSATGTANANNQIKPDADGNLTKSFVTTPKDSLKVYTKYLAVQATAEYDKLIRRNYTVILA